MDITTKYLTKESEENFVLRVDTDGHYWKDRVGGKTHRSWRKENQDVLLCLDGLSGFNIANDTTTDENHKASILVGVLDGHGKYGKRIPEKVVDCFAEYACQMDCSNDDSASAVKPQTININKCIESAMETMFNNAHDRIANTEWNNFNGRYSGTTVSVAHITPTQFTIANVGDTDIIFGTEGENGILNAKVISVPHRPELEEEKKRIEEAGGLVEAQRNNHGKECKGPLRIWMKDIRTPGLMVSRSIGDTVSHENLGVIATPFTFSSDIKQEDKIIIIASDGVWDFVTPSEAILFVDKFLDPVLAAEGLVELAVSRQKIKQFDNASAIIIFLEEPEKRKSRLESTHENYEKILEDMCNQIEQFKKINLTPVEKRSPSQAPAEGSVDDHHTHVEFVESNADGKTEPVIVKGRSRCCSIM